MLGVLNKNALFDDGRPSVYEHEVRINDKIPLSLHRGESTGADEDSTPNEAARKELLLNQQKSTPVEDPTRMEGNLYSEDFKSEVQEIDESDSAALTNHKKQASKKKLTKGKNKADKCKDF